MTLTGPSPSCLSVLCSGWTGIRTAAAEALEPLPPEHTAEKDAECQRRTSIAEACRLTKERPATLLGRTHTCSLYLCHLNRSLASLGRSVSSDQPQSGSAPRVTRGN